MTATETDTQAPEWQHLWSQMVEDLGATLNEFDNPEFTPAQILEWAISWLIVRDKLILK